MTQTQTQQQRQFDYERQTFAASILYVTTLISAMTGVERAAVRTAIIYDTQSALKELSTKGTSGEIPDELVASEMQRQVAERLTKWGLSK